MKPLQELIAKDLRRLIREQHVNSIDITNQKICCYQTLQNILNAKTETINFNIIADIYRFLHHDYIDLKSKDISICIKL